MMSFFKPTCSVECSMWQSFQFTPLSLLEEVNEADSSPLAMEPKGSEGIEELVKKLSLSGTLILIKEFL